MIILAIETSCDETSAAVVENDRIISNKISSQIEIHKKWGGVVPGIAKRLHQENIDFVIKDALKLAKMSVWQMDAIAVTQGPGLAIALEVGIAKAKALAKEFNKPLIAVNHMEGHIYSCLAKNSKGLPPLKLIYPFLALLISGGHTEIVLCEKSGEYKILGRTLDDAVGEAFDKVSRMLELGYPGGPVIEQLAKNGDPDRFKLPVPMAKTASTDFSYSGLKTAVLYLTKKELAEKSESMLPMEKRQLISDIAAAFQTAAIEALILKTDFAIKNVIADKEIKNILVAGGVSANLYLRKKFRQCFGENYNILFPVNKKLIGDNAGMIGVCAYHKSLRGEYIDASNLERTPNLSFVGAS